MTVVVIPSRAKESYNVNNIRRLLRHLIPRNDIVKRIFQKFQTIKIAKKELLNGLLGKIIPILVKSNKVPRFC